MSVPEPPPAGGREEATAAATEDVLGRRIASALVDLALLAGVFVALALAVGDASSDEGTVSLSLTGWPAALYFGLVLLYYFALEAFFGQTLGKLLFGLRVERAGEERASPASVAVRTLLRIVDWLPFLCFVGFVAMMATGRRRQRLGDLAAKTVVVRAPGVPRAGMLLVPAVLLAIGIVTLALYRAMRSEDGGSSPAANRASAPPVGAQLFRDDFSSTRTGWYVGRSRDSSDGYAGGR